MTGDTFARDMIRDLTGAGITQGQVARAVGVTPAAVSRWVNGIWQPSGYSLFKLARLHRHLTHAERGVA